MYRGIVVSYMACWKFKKILYILQYKHRDELQNNKFKSYQFIFLNDKERYKSRCKRMYLLYDILTSQ